MSAGRLAKIVAWIGAFALAVAVDRPVARYVVVSGLGPALKSNWHWITKIARLPGNVLTYTLPAAILLSLRGRKWWKPAWYVLICGIFSGLAQLLKWIVGRPRPFHENVYDLQPFTRGWDGLIHETNLSFPSGDVCLAAATSVALMMLLPRRRGTWLTLVGIVAAERLAEGSHYPSDVVAGAALGAILAHLAWRILQPIRPSRLELVPGSE